MANKVGVRIYHIDSRIFKCKVVDYMGGQKLAYVDGYVWDGQMLQDDEAILMPISNNMSESKISNYPKVSITSTKSDCLNPVESIL